jgi:hypothetical protein
MVTPGMIRLISGLLFVLVLGVLIWRRAHKNPSA